MARSLHLGVIVTPYDGGQQTTADVAEILEKNYGVLGGYVSAHNQDIANSLARSVASAIGQIAAGGAVIDPLARATSQISTGAKTFISSREAERVLAPGRDGHPVPTEAALSGISSRKKGGKKGRRPSFVDTGIYENSLICWSEDN